MLLVSRIAVVLHLNSSFILIKLGLLLRSNVISSEIDFFGRSWLDLFHILVVKIIVILQFVLANYRSTLIVVFSSLLLT
jgi:hypothetical protein